MEKTYGQAVSVQEKVRVVVLGHSEDEVCARG